MSDLSPSAQALVRAGAQAARPSAMDRQRLTEALGERLGDAVVLGDAAAAAAAPSAAGALWVKVWAATIGLGVLVGGAALVLRSEPAPFAPPAERASIFQPEAAVAPVVAAPEATRAAVEGPAAPKAESVPAPASAPRRPADRLAQEVALLSRATSALRSGRAADALKALSEHQSQFPKGALSEERRAARAQALCLLGRRNDAQADLATLARTSPQAARARQVCASTR